VEIRSLAAAVPFVTADGSTIRSLLDRTTAPVQLQSLAEATIEPGGATVRHLHRDSEEIYYLVQGQADMELDGRHARVAAGDAVLIPPGSWHRIENTGAGPLRLLCCCAPPYRHEDTFFEESEEPA
jgi:mannose-6-phosphate isomerase-like protein (cupin superfamily)